MEEIREEIKRLNEKIEQHKAVNELTEISQKMGLYDNCEYSGLPNTSSYED